MNMDEVNFEEDSAENDEKVNAETDVDHSLSSGSPREDGISGDTVVLPRVGNQYQVEIPSLMENPRHLELQHNPNNDNDVLGYNYCIGRGFSVPITWISYESDSINHEQEEVPGTMFGAHSVGAHGTIDNKERWMYPNCTTVSGSLPDSLNSCETLTQSYKTEIPDDQSEHGKQLASLPSLDCRPADCHSWLQPRKTKVYIPLPCSPVAIWSDAESQSFLLGLYMFGKNLVQVKSFVESREMGDVLTFYYGTFFRSDAHRRWVECRKMKSKRCILGHRIFAGWRQQELLSRLLPNKVKEVQDTLLEAAKGFNEGRTSLEEFVFTLKATVGMQALVQAVGIGKGKQDLTGIVQDPVRTNVAIPIRPEIPTGKACSSLTSEEIIKFLTGDFRLSKARSNDLFWEAVWPRLLARGWHSEQPKDVVYLSSKNALVFLMPGIKKFSRRKLVKGNHYFDSVSDVLNKVASDPGLLELEGEEGSRINHEIRLGQNGVSDHQRHCYLRPRLPECNSELMKFTVVDTSLVQGEEPFKVRELRNLPPDVTSRYCPSDPSGETDSDSSMEQSSSADMSFNGKGESDRSLSDDKKVRDGRKSTSGKGVVPDISDRLVTDPNQRFSPNGQELEGECSHLLIGKPTIKDTKHQLSRRVKCREPNYLAPVSKRQRLTSCKSLGTGSQSDSLPEDTRLKKEKHFRLKPHEDSKVLHAEGENFQGKFRELAVSRDNPRPRTMIDLNLPQFPPDFETEGLLGMEVEGSKNYLNSEESQSQSGTKQLNDFQAFVTNDVVPAEEQPATNALRHSTRTRPPTTKALEALACGFLSTKRGKGGNTTRSSNLKSRSSRRARRTCETFLPTPDSNPGTVNASIGIPTVEVEGEYSRTPNQASLFNNSHVSSERDETQSPKLLGVL